MNSYIITNEMAQRLASEKNMGNVRPSPIEACITGQTSKITFPPLQSPKGY